VPLQDLKITTSIIEIIDRVLLVILTDSWHRVMNGLRKYSLTNLVSLGLLVARHLYLSRTSPSEASNLAQGGKHYALVAKNFFPAYNALYREHQSHKGYEI
jgi:hypothetical protein